MTNAEIIQAIRNEIESLKSIEYPCDNSQQATGFFNALDRMTDFLSTLESETTYDTQQYTPRPSVGIEDVARVQFASHAKVFDKKRKAVFDWEQFKEVAGIFYGFGKKDHSDTLESEKPMNPEAAMKELDEKIALVKQRGTWDGVDVDSYMDEVRGRVSDDLEEAADNHIRRVADAAGHPGWDWTTQDIADAFIAGASWQKQHDAELIEIAYNDGITIGMTKQKEQDEKEQAELFTIVALDAAQRAKIKIMEDFPKWRKIKAGERLPCPAYVWTIAYDNYPDCFEGRLMPNIQGVKVGRDTWYLPVDVIHNLPKED